MRRLAILLLGLLAVSGCRKKMAPEFYELESNYSIMVARDGDDAYASPDMDAVLAGLQKIPADTVEGPKAAALVATITAEKARVAREAKEAADALAAAAKIPEPPAPGPSLFPPPPSEPAPAVDAGPGAPPKPYQGMPMADFLKYYGECFVPGPARTIPGNPEGVSQQLKGDRKCRAEYNAVDPRTSVFFVFVKDGLVGQITETAPAQPEKKAAPPPAVDAGNQTFLVVPGAPLPPELGGPPAPPEE